LKVKTVRTFNTIFSMSSFISLAFSMAMFTGIIPNKMEVETESMSFLGEGITTSINLLPIILIITIVASLVSLYWILKHFKVFK